MQTELARARTDRLKFREAQWAIASASPVEHLPEVVTNGTITVPIAVDGTAAARAQLGTAFTPSYPKVKRLQAQIAELEQAIERDRSTIINRIRTETRAAVQRETLLQNAYRPAGNGGLGRSRSRHALHDSETGGRQQSAPV